MAAKRAREPRAVLSKLASARRGCARQRRWAGYTTGARGDHRRKRSGPSEKSCRHATNLQSKHDSWRRKGKGRARGEGERKKKRSNSKSKM